MGESITAAFQRGLNQHGFGFQHRVIAEAARLLDERGSKWRLLSIEQPVSAGEEHTKIDFLLHCRQESKVWILVAECKRVNPSFGRWCFARGAYHQPHWLGTQVIHEVLNLAHPRSSLAGGGENSDRIFDIGFTLKTGQSGDTYPVSNDKDAIEHACSQLVRGLNGLISGIGADPRLVNSLQGAQTVTFLPVIFTTANLYTSKVDLAGATLETGDVSLNEEAEHSDWLNFQYPQSPGVRHPISPTELQLNDVNSWAAVVARDYWRTISVVSPRGISNFLKRDPPGWY